MQMSKDLKEPLIMTVIVDDDRAQTPDDEDSFVFSWSKFGSFVGPGLLMSTAFLDPGNVAACL